MSGLICHICRASFVPEAPLTPAKPADKQTDVESRLHARWNPAGMLVQPLLEHRDGWRQCGTWNVCALLTMVERTPVLSLTRAEVVPA
jgi:hypothetical protein